MHLLCRQIWVRLVTMETIEDEAPRLKQEYQRVIMRYSQRRKLKKVNDSLRLLNQQIMFRVLMNVNLMCSLEPREGRKTWLGQSMWSGISMTTIPHKPIRQSLESDHTVDHLKFITSLSHLLKMNHSHHYTHFLEPLTKLGL